MKYYSFDVSYNNCPEVFTYYFRAKSVEQVAKATGIPTCRISERTNAEIRNASLSGAHIDTVVRGRLIETEASA